MSEPANVLSLLSWSYASQASHNISTVLPSSFAMLHNNLELCFLALSFLPLFPMAVVLCLRRCIALKKEERKEAHKALWTLAFNLAKTAYVRGNREQLVEMVQECKIDINGFREPNTGLTLLLCACLSGQSELVKFLLDRGADCRARTSEGDSALLLSTYACCTLKSSDPLLLDVLACRGISINEQNERGDSALSVAAQYGKTRLVSVLLQYGADPFLPNYKGILPIDFAGRSGNFEATKLLENYMRRSH